MVTSWQPVKPHVVLTTEASLEAKSSVHDSKISITRACSVSLKQEASAVIKKVWRKSDLLREARSPVEKAEGSIAGTEEGWSESTIVGSCENATEDVGTREGTGHGISECEGCAGVFPDEPGDACVGAVVLDGSVDP
jgi:hypothetical protein